MSQHAFDLPVRADFGRASYLVSGCNQAAFDEIQRWPNWPARALVLHGPRGSGKTHLAHLWRERAGAALMEGQTILGAEPRRIAGPVAVDNAQQAEEKSLLHLYNTCIEHGTSLLLTLPAPPAAVPIALADLASRLRALPAVGIAAPDDALLAAVLIKHFADRQIRVSPGVIAYLVPRMERSFAAAGAVAGRLDRMALGAGKPVTVALARAVLAELAA